FKGLLSAVRSENAPIRFQARAIVASQLALIALGIALHHPWVYFILWLAPYLTVWRVINRLRSIAEHGGMQRSKDRRLTTHSVRQSPLSRFFLVPYHIGWHLAHHVDAGVPMAHLPALHAELRRAGYVVEGLEYRNYTSLWRKLASGASLEG
ncbi:MAG TPA: fatty acid desaturase, partial [Acidimicrobiia bacterium]